MLLYAHRVNKSEPTRYTTSTIRAFMCGVRENEKIATAIAQALGIER